MKKISLLAVLLLIATKAFAVSTDTCVDIDAVVMLHMNGSDGSTTFTDNATCAGCPNTYTAAGNAQIDTAQSKFDGASGLFDGTGDTVTTPASSEFDTAKIITLDFWVRFNTDPSANGIALFDTSDNCTTNGIALILDAASNNLTAYLGDCVGTGRTWNPTNNTWYHVAMTRDGSDNVKLFIDGTQIGTTFSDTTDITDQSGVIISADRANDFDGWIDEIRLVDGTAVWTTNFTPPTSAYSVCGTAPDPTGQASVGSNPLII